MGGRLKWRGDEVLADLERAVRNGMDETMAACVARAKADVPVRTTTLQGSIQFRPAQREGNRIVGRWGSFDVNYARWVEEGTEPHVIRPRKAKALWWEGLDHPVGAVQHPGTKARPYLRPAADAEYPQLAERIRGHMP